MTASRWAGRCEQGGTVACRGEEGALRLSLPTATLNCLSLTTIVLAARTYSAFVCRLLMACSLPAVLHELKVE